MKRIALMFVATAALIVPAASSAFATPSHTNGVLPEQLCFATTPWPAQPVTCGQGTGDH
jgi:hypothetical protein